MNITVNAVARQVEPGTTVARLVEQCSGTSRGVAVAVGGSVVPRTEWASRELVADDAVELLAAVQGG